MVNMDDYVKSTNFGGMTTKFLIANVPKAEEKVSSSAVDFSLSKSVIRHALEDNDNQYMLFLLYGNQDLKVIGRFLENKGSYINNFLGKDINLYTNYSRETYEKWGNVKGRDILDSQDFGDEKDFRSMIQLAQAFGLSNFTDLPALVLVDKGDTSKFASIILKGKNEEEIASVITSVKKNIDTNYGNFEKICNSLSASVTRADALAFYTEKIDPFVLIDDYCNERGMTYSDISLTCNIDERRLRRIRNNVGAKINRDEIIKIALSLGMSVDDTNELLYSYDLADLRETNRRDAVFIKELKKEKPVEGFGLVTISDNLKKEKLIGLINS